MNQIARIRDTTRTFAISLVAVFASLAIPTTSFGWGSRAHQTIGEIAEKNLTATAAQSILDIMGPERLALTAIWADEVREDAAFAGFDDYHIVNISSGFTYATRPEAEKDPKDAVTVLKKYPELLKDPNTPRSVKIIALRYIVHVVGDIHQPLHVGNRFDYGGNACRVQMSAGQMTNLHTLWDRILVEDDMGRMKKLTSSTKKFYRFDEYARDIIKTSALSEAKLKKIRSGTYMDWIDESQSLRTSTYPDTTPVDDFKRVYCQKTVEPEKIPLLTESFKKDSMALAQKQILHAGLRLAEFLNQIFSGPSQPGTNVQLTRAEILKQLEVTN